MKVEYSKTCDQDLKGINELIQAVRDDPKSIYKPPCFFDAEDIRISDRYISFIVKDRDQTIGFIELRGNTSFQDEGSSADIILFVHPEHKRNRHATNLIKTIESFAQTETKLKKLIAGIQTGNTPSEILVKLKGFNQDFNSLTGTTYYKYL